MSCGLPVIGVDEGAIGEVITNEVGFRVSSRDAEDIASGIRAFLSEILKWVSGRMKMEEERSIVQEATKPFSIMRRVLPRELVAHGVNRRRDSPAEPDELTG